MARANLNKIKELVTSTTAASIEIIPFRPPFINFSKTVSYEVNLASQCSHLKVLYEVNFGLKGGISIDADSGPLR